MPGKTPINKLAILLAGVAAFTPTQAADPAEFDVLKYVDPLIGTANGGHVFAGATLPFGMAKAVADVTGDNQGGFASDGSKIIGFSHMHDSGTGGSPSLGNFPLFPHPGCPGNNFESCQYNKGTRAVNSINGSEKASPGYFSVVLETGVQGEATVTEHTALYRFMFPNGTSGTEEPAQPLIQAELSDLPNSFRKGEIAVDNATGRITGNGTFAPSFGSGTYNAHFCADFSGATIVNTGVYRYNEAGLTPKRLLVNSQMQSDGPFGAWVQFQPPKGAGRILARVGLSFISIEQACQNAEREIPEFDFNGVKKAAEAAWRTKLGVMTIDAGNASTALQKVFWSGAYRTFISPQDYTGENPLWTSQEPYFDSFYCIWDSFRTIHPLLTILDPQAQTLMIRSLLDVYRHEGWLPDCRMSLCKGYTQGGSNADVVLADALVKGLTADIDWETAYAAVVKDAEREPKNWDLEGRGGLRSWKKLHYIPVDDVDKDGTGLHTRSISRTVEYAYNDFCIAQMAQKFGKAADYKKYAKRSTYWKNLFKEDLGYQDPLLCSPLLDFTGCYLTSTGHETYEGSAWLYTFYAPHDMASLIQTLGGAKPFARRLLALHRTPGLLYMGDEQAFLTVYLGHYAGRPDLASSLAHRYIPHQFNATRAGIPGNDDSGAMGSFAVFAMLGLFPVAGQDVYLVSAPFFREASITNPLTNRTATIRARNWDPKSKARFVVEASLNGEPWSANWISHRFFAEGGVLELVLGETKGSWGTQEADLPPSLSL
ncbi:glycoside hydrolase family 92 protein [Aplosporella prunicola CBS 121167]|uniref:Glycoside hydrolase family 92 protein n=1 Tax=Aplosporella prunicola CBS 121167 TaxID=1176127 RepID=A0A6A6B443_9PEZI|nr:glycoside hydrolase family 92 protein [Aplosporella prunicola CBS 121167]KAF2137511.1 glycoside hydrolase family 92 protein [Aplosporella prunicola CBS 121167]